MKSIIIILATVILGVYIGATLINGDSSSLKSGATGIVNEANQEITEGLID